MTKDQEKTWADLDSANAAHYASKARPDWFRDAEKRRDGLQRAHDFAVEAYLQEAERSDCSPYKVDLLFNEMLSLENQWIAADLYLTECRIAYLNNLSEPRKTYEEILSGLSKPRGESET